jgi:hypothetical protein
VKYRCLVWTSCVSDSRRHFLKGGLEGGDSPGFSRSDGSVPDASEPEALCRPSGPISGRSDSGAVGCLDLGGPRGAVKKKRELSPGPPLVHAATTGRPPTKEDASTSLPHAKSNAVGSETLPSRQLTATEECLSPAEAREQNTSCRSQKLALTAHAKKQKHTMGLIPFAPNNVKDFSLSFQSTFHRSFTLLVRYRSW